MTPKVSYHGGHSGELCDHARDTKTQLIEAYIAKGFSHVGITEHLPPHHNAHLYPDEIEQGHNAAFLTERTDHFFAHTRPALQHAYGDKLHLLFGFETEFYSEKPLDRITTCIEKYAPDIVVASVHHVHDMPFDVSRAHYQRAAQNLGGLNALYAAYYDQQFALLKHLTPFTSQFPVIVGHFDIIKLFSPAHIPSPAVQAKMSRNITYAVENGYIFEANSRAYKKGLNEPFPGPATLAEIAQQGGEITLGDDSHAASEAGLHLAKTLAVVSEYFDRLTAFEQNGQQLKKVHLF